VFRYNGDFYTVRPDGTDLRALIHAFGPIGFPPDWSPAGDRVLFSAKSSSSTNDLFWIAPDSSDLHAVTSTSDADELSGVWSPDGSEIAFIRGGNTGQSLWKVNDAGSGLVRLSSSSNLEHQPSWQPLPPLPPHVRYARPMGATPMTVSLVPAYRACASANDTHGAPLAFGSCSPPQQTSDSLTVGTPDSNGAAANSASRVDFKAVAGNPATQADEADVSVNATITDVRCRLDFVTCEGGALSDYLGTLELDATLRITDAFNGGTSDESATVTDSFRMQIPIQCTATVAATIGATCDLQTTLEALYPGAVREGKRSIWELGQVLVRDGNVDDPRVDTYQTFMVQGLFVP
jgi:hypothetical protein